MEYRKRDLTEIDITPVDKESPIPLYQQVRLDLLKLLRSGNLQTGDMLPNEHALCEAYQVGRQTLRKAVIQLVDDHMLERTPGRGTTVMAWEDRRKFFLNRSFAQQMMEMGLVPHSEVLRKVNRIIDESSPGSLHKMMGAEALELIRLRYGNETPIGVQYTTVITERCPDLSDNNFEVASLYNLLLTKYRLPIARIDQVVHAVIADEWHKTLLKISGVAPLLLVKTTAYLGDGQPIEASTSYYRAEHYEFSIVQDYD